MNILSLNAGSSSLKYKLFAMPAEDVLAKGSLDHPGGTGIMNAAGEAIERCRPLGVDAFAHRVVHGGPVFSQPARVSPEMLRTLHGILELDPLHNATEVAMMEMGLRTLPETPAVAVFDTAFHQTLPRVASTYAVPFEIAEEHGLRRYGFHGISHKFVSTELLKAVAREPRGSRVITCHLGGGASVCAIVDGKSVDTSMGMTPVEGLVMGTRSGDVDPGLMLYMMRTEKLSRAGLDDLLNHKSGLLGLSGLSADVREIESAATAGDERCELALDVFAYRVTKYIGSYAAAMGGVDAVAFTGGIGEHSGDVRARICRTLGFLGIRLDDDRNRSATGGAPANIGADGTQTAVWVIPTDEERQIAREAFETLGSSATRR